MASRQVFSSNKILTLLNAIAPGRFEEVPSSQSSDKQKLQSKEEKSIPSQYQAREEGTVSEMNSDVFRQEDFDRYLQNNHKKEHGYQLSHVTCYRGEDRYMQKLTYPTLTVANQHAFLQFLARENKKQNLSSSEVAEAEAFLECKL